MGMGIPGRWLEEGGDDRLDVVTGLNVGKSAAFLGQVEAGSREDCSGRCVLLGRAVLVGWAGLGVEVMLAGADAGAADACWRRGRAGSWYVRYGGCCAVLCVPRRNQRAAEGCAVCVCCIP